MFSTCYELTHVLPSRMVRWNELCNPDEDETDEDLEVVLVVMVQTRAQYQRKNLTISTSKAISFPQDRPPGGNWPKPIEKKLSCCIFSLDKFDPSNGQLVLIDQTRYGCQTLSHCAFSGFSFLLVVPYYNKAMAIMIMLMITNSSDDDNGNRGYEWCWAWPSKEQWGDGGVNRWAIIIIIHSNLF